MIKENNGWISVNSTKQNEIPLLKPFYVKTKNYGDYVGFLDTFPSDIHFSFYDDYGNGFNYKWHIPELACTFPFDEVEVFAPVPEANEVFQKTNWISVTDSLPESNDDFYLVFTESRRITECRYYCNDWITTYCNNEKVTHWQPLPPPPTK